MGFNYLFFLLVMLPSEVPELDTDLPVRVFPGVWKLLSFLRLPSQDGAPSLPLLSLFLSIFSYLLSKTMGCLSRCLMSSASIQKFFVEFTQHSNVLLMNFQGEKLVSPAYSFSVLGPPLPPFSLSFKLYI